MRNLTDINIVLDRSGSMNACRQATIDAFNEFVNGQRVGVGEAVISLFQFDHEYEPVRHCQLINVKDAPRLDAYSYLPRGSTALLDAIGRTIDAIGARLSNTPEYDRPSKVLMVIVTDGQENASSQYTRSRIFDMIRHQQDRYNWTFVFLGANQDSYTEAGHMGFGHHNTMNYAPTSAGMKHISRSLSDSTHTLRAAAGGQSCNTFFSSEDQKIGDQMAGVTAPKNEKDWVAGVKKTIDEVNASNKHSTSRKTATVSN